MGLYALQGRSKAFRALTKKKFTFDQSKKNFVIGFENCVCTLEPSVDPKKLGKAISKATPVPGAKEWVNSLIAQGHFVCVFTPLPEKFRRAVSSWLKTSGFSYTSLVMDKPRALMYHYVDDRHVQATTFRGKYTPLIKKEHTIEVFG